MTAAANLWAAASRLTNSALARSSGIYFVGNVLARGVPFLLLPVLTRYLTRDEFGTVAMFMVAVNLTVPLVGLNTDGAISRQYYDRDRIDFPAYVTTCLAILAVTGTVTALGLWLFGGPVAAALALPASWLWVVLAVATGRYFTNTAMLLWQSRGRPRPYAIFSLLQTAVTLSLATWLVVRGGGWQGRVAGEAIGVTLFAVIAVIVMIRQGLVVPRTGRDHLDHALKFGGGLVPHVYGGVLIAATDRFLVTHMVGIGATGLYAVGAQIAMIILVLEHSFNQAWIPWLFARLKRADPQELRQVRQIVRVYNVVILALALGLAVAAPWFLSFFVGESFADAAPYVFWLALAGAFSGMYKMVVNPIYYASKTYLLAWTTFATGAANVVFTYLLIRWNGPVGAAQGTALAMFVSYVSTRILAARVAPLPA